MNNFLLKILLLCRKARSNTTSRSFNSSSHIKGTAVYKITEKDVQYPVSVAIVFSFFFSFPNSPDWTDMLLKLSGESLVGRRTKRMGLERIRDDDKSRYVSAGKTKSHSPSEP